MEAMMYDYLQQNDRFGELLLQSWRTYDRLRDQQFLVRPAIPILYFGDTTRYFSSDLKVVTVGLNPSGNEFPEGRRFGRFPVPMAMATDPAQREHQCHRAALDAYFETDPYWGWFNSLEPILNGMDVSYEQGLANVAVHTDLCSPIATAPTWSKLSNKQKHLLESDGISIWHSLLEVLAPDVIVVSIAERYLDQIQFPVVTPRHGIWELDRDRPYRVSGTWLTIKSSRRCLLAFGRAAQTPFGTVSKATKPEIGRAIKDFYYAHSR
jgi:hypothetical protein